MFLWVSEKSSWKRGLREYTDPICLVGGRGTCFREKLMKKRIESNKIAKSSNRRVVSMFQRKAHEKEDWELLFRFFPTFLFLPRFREKLMKKRIESSTAYFYLTMLYICVSEKSSWKRGLRERSSGEGLSVASLFFCFREKLMKKRIEREVNSSLFSFSSFSVSEKSSWKRGLRDVAATKPRL